MSVNFCDCPARDTGSIEHSAFCPARTTVLAPWHGASLARAKVGLADQGAFSGQRWDQSSKGPTAAIVNSCGESQSDVHVTTNAVPTFSLAPRDRVISALLELRDTPLQTPASDWPGCFEFEMLEDA